MRVGDCAGGRGATQTIDGKGHSCRLARGAQAAHLQGVRDMNLAPVVMRWKNASYAVEQSPFVEQRARLRRSTIANGCKELLIRWHDAEKSKRHDSANEDGAGWAATLQPLILRSHQPRVISSFQPADNEVTPCHLLEMVYE